VTSSPRTGPMAPSGFDRLRTRVPDLEATSSGSHDSEGKRALFSSSSSEASDRPSVGSVTIDCQRCDERTVLSLAAGVRAATPAFVLSVGLGRGERESTLGLLRRHYGTFMRCPACGRASWTRFTVRV
jgi:hypothetical protein